MFLRSLLLCLLISTSLHAQPTNHGPMDPSIKPGYRYLSPSEIYGSCEANSAAAQISRQQAEALLDAGLWEGQKRAIMSALCFVLPFPLSLYATERFTETQNINENVVLSLFKDLSWGIVYVTGGMQMIGDAVSPFFQRIVEFFSPLPKDILRGIEIAFIQRKAWMGPQTCHDMADRLFAVRNGQSKLWDHLTLFKVLTEFPLNPRPVTYQKEVLEEALENYEAVLREDLLDVAYMIAHAPRKQTFYFHGAPGLGKTRAAERLAEGLKLPLCSLDLPGKNPSDLLGSNDRMGDLSQCFFQNNVTNPVILLNDADRVLATDPQMFNFFLSLIDPAQKTLFDPYLKTKVDFSRVTFIITANFDLKAPASAQEGAVNALVERIAKQVEFLPPSDETKKHIVTKYLQQILPSGISEDDFQSLLNKSLSLNTSSVRQLLLEADRNVLRWKRKQLSPKDKESSDKGVCSQGDDSC